MNYNREHFIQFLEALDGELSKNLQLIIIGGASLSLAYNSSNVTIDIDVINKMNKDLEEAISRAKKKSHLNIPVSTTLVRAEILHMERRLYTPVELYKLINLKILVPEKHDLALMKAARNEARDIQDIQGLHAKDPLDPEILLMRFKEEVLTLNSGDDSILKEKFLEMIESLFGSELSNQLEKRF